MHYMPQAQAQAEVEMQARRGAGGSSWRGVHCCRETEVLARRGPVTSPEPQCCGAQCGKHPPQGSGTLAVYQQCVMLSGASCSAARHVQQCVMFSSASCSAVCHVSTARREPQTCPWQKLFFSKPHGVTPAPATRPLRLGDGNLLKKTERAAPNETVTWLVESESVPSSRISVTQIRTRLQLGY